MQNLLTKTKSGVIKMDAKENTTMKQDLIEFIKKLTDEECNRLIVSLINIIEKEQP